MLKLRYNQKAASKLGSFVCPGGRGEKGLGFTGFAISALVSISFPYFSYSQEQKIVKIREVSGKLSPKSIVHDGFGNFAAQNMMYRHSVVFFNTTGDKVNTLKDTINLRRFGFDEYTGQTYLGAPVEAVFSGSGKYLYVSNYQMEGQGFDNPGCDGCHGNKYDPSFVYKIDCSSKKVVDVYKTGAVPKFMALSKNDSLLVVSNWSSGDVSFINTFSGETDTTVKVGRHPRGIATSSDNKRVYIAIMGSTEVAEIDAENYAVRYLTDIGKGPRHLCLSESDSILYISVSSASQIVRYNLKTDSILRCNVNHGPRSMILSPDENYLYVVNYFANTFSKIRTDSLRVVAVRKTNEHPIGIAANWTTGDIWVACYTGTIQIFRDFSWLLQNRDEGLVDNLISYFNNFSMRNSGVDASQTPCKETTKDSPAKSSINSSKPADDEVVKNTKMTANQGPEQKKSIENSYHLILGAFSSYENAIKRRDLLVKNGFQPQLIKGNSGLTYVSAASFSSRTKAQENIRDVRDKTGIEGWILKR